MTAVAAAGFVSTGSAFAACKDERISENKVLGGPNAKHRVCLTAWPFRNPREQAGLDETAKSFKTPTPFFAWLKENGYEGVEITVDDCRARWWPDVAPKEIVARVKRLSQDYKISITGSLYHVSDDGHPWCGPQELDFAQPDFFKKLASKLELEKEMGSQYVTFQICLPERYMNTGGAYRNDEAFLQLAACRVAKMQDICFNLGLNFYVETHIDRISEDPEAFCKIFDRAPYFEVNADISHYVYRGISKGPHLQRILARVGHTHQRMARVHGDLSSDLGTHFSEQSSPSDASEDWKRKGVTWLAFDAMRPCFEGGLSSRCVVGESGPAFGPKDALLLDAKLVPLYKAMCRYADERAANTTSAPPPVANPFA